MSKVSLILHPFSFHAFCLLVWSCHPKTNKLLASGRGVGIVVSSLAFYFDEPSSNTAGHLFLIFSNVLQKDKIKLWPIKKYFLPPNLIKNFQTISLPPTTILFWSTMTKIQTMLMLLMMLTMPMIPTMLLMTTMSIGASLFGRKIGRRCDRRRRARN